jgi:hypothetical protein
MVQAQRNPANGIKTICLVFATLCSASWVTPTFAGPSAGLFNVSVTIKPAAVQLPPLTPAVPPSIPPGLQISAFCSRNNIPSAHGALVTIVCSTGAVVAIEPSSTLGQAFTPMHGGAYRYVTQVSPNGTLLDTVDAFSGAGTTTAWRVVHSTDRDYLEMTLGW